MTRRIRILLVLGSLLWALALTHASPLRSAEYLMFIPAPAKAMDAQNIAADIHLWVYENERRTGARTTLSLLLNIDFEALTPEQTLRFEERARLFLKDSERGKRITVQLKDGSTRTLDTTGADGRSVTRIYATADALDKNGALPFSVTPPAPSGQGTEGFALLVPEQGVSVVSDIDDTIKISHVQDTRQLLRDTFLEPFKPVPGMAAWYQSLAGQEGVAFHYLSSSPIQLYPPLQAFMDASGFPKGTMHLRASTSWDTLVAVGDESREHKLAALHKLIQDFPKRRFVLVGDSGEADPEVYADIARQYPEHVQAIYIRNVTDEADTAERYRRVFMGVDRAVWHVFDDPPASFPALLP